MFVDKIWSGEKQPSYWPILLAPIVMWAAFALERAGIPPARLLYVPYWTVVCVGTWRSTNNYVKSLFWRVCIKYVLVCLSIYGFERITGLKVWDLFMHTIS